jgi:hypothetical protein
MPIGKQGMPVEMLAVDGKIIEGHQASLIKRAKAAPL